MRPPPAELEPVDFATSGNGLDEARSQHSGSTSTAAATITSSMTSSTQTTTVAVPGRTSASTSIDSPRSRDLSPAEFLADIEVAVTDRDYRSDPSETATFGDVAASS